MEPEPKPKPKLPLHFPLWALLPALADRKVAKRILASNQPLTPERKAYLEDVIRQGNVTEEVLRRHGYYDPGPRGEAFRATGNVYDTDEEALETLKKLEARDRDSRAHGPSEG